MNKKRIYENGPSSRINKIFIELHNYSFFHAPSEIDKVDRRFIGREKIMRRIKTILQFNEIRSGAYLISGYRGMGKSSMLSKVINDLEYAKIRFFKNNRMIQIFLILLPLMMIDYKSTGWLNNYLAIYIPLFLATFLGIYIYQKVPSRNNLKITNNKIFDFSLLNLFNSLFLYEENNTDRKAIFRLQIIFKAMLVQIVAFWFLKFLTVIFVFRLLIYLALIFAMSMIDRYAMGKFNEKIDQQKYELRDLGSNLIDYLSSIFKLNKRIYIRLNLGYDNLKEIDILKLVAKSVEKEFIALHKRVFSHLHYTIFKLMLIFMLAGVFYYFDPIYKVNLSFKQSIEIPKWLPSQTESFLVQNSIGNEIKLTSLDELKDKTFANKMTIYADYIFFSTYKKLYKHSFAYLPILKLSDLFYFPGIRAEFCFIPAYPDYFFIAYFLILLIFVNYILPSLLGFTTNRMVIKKIKELNEIINYKLTMEFNGSSNFSQHGVNIGRSKKTIKSREIADIREIEDMLIGIFKDISKLDLFAVRPHFIFIFDELDKIEPRENINLANREAEELSNFNKYDNAYFSTDSVRDRQQTILKILSNLKHFLNTARSKFFFIAGREMYDMYLAGISDRNYFMGSIFHEVFYVDSFLKDPFDKKYSNLTSMTEEYLCRFLFPPAFKQKSNSLKEYARYLDLFFSPKDPDRQEKINQVITTLNNFIIYVTYRSNGAPKKITNYLEHYLYRTKKPPKGLKKQLKADFVLTVGVNYKSLYLDFKYFDQYTFNMMSYTVNPFILSIGRSVKFHDDKLLISISFLIDHLYKFHKFAFSWRNIELMPEIVDINKSPQLREVISEIIDSLSYNQIDNIVAGLYDFKFNNAVSEEISYLSKISGYESAAFNFTLDESLALKKHYKKILIDLYGMYKMTKDDSGKEQSRYHNSISSVHMILAELHYYDEEYADANTEFQEALCFLKPLETKIVDSVPDFIDYVGIMLKLALSYERSKLYNKAFAIYGDLICKIVDYREIDLSSLGLMEYQLNENSPHPRYLQVLNKRDGKNNIINKSLEKFDSVFLETNGNDVSSFNSQIKLPHTHNQKFVASSENFNELLTDTSFTPLKEKILYKISVFENIRLVYIPLIARFQMIEKINLNGICQTDIHRLEKEFEYLSKTINSDEKYLIEVAFWSKTADILYFKNYRQDIHASKEHCCAPCKENANSEKCHNDFCNKNIGIDTVIKQGYKTPCTACRYYIKAMNILNDKFFHNGDGHKTNTRLDHGNDQNSNGSKLIKIYSILQQHSLCSKKSNLLKITASLCSGIGNTFLSCSTDLPGIDFLCKYFLLFEHYESSTTNEINPVENFLEKEKDFNKMEECLVYYFFSFRLHQEAGAHKGAYLQLKKILYTFRNLLSDNDGKIVDSARHKVKGWICENLDQLEKHLVNNAIKAIYRSYSNIHRLEIENYRNIFNIVSTNDVKLKNTSINGDITELVTLFEEIKIVCGAKNLVDFSIDPYWSATSYSRIHRMYSRIVELKYKGLINYKLFKQLGFKDTMDEFQKVKALKIIDYQHFIESLIKVNYGIDAENTAKNTSKNIRANLDIIDKLFKVKHLHNDYDKIMAALEFLILDSIFCYHEIIQIIKLYGISYRINYSLLASAHHKMADWCDYLDTIKKTAGKNKVKRMLDDLGNLIQVENLEFVSTRYHYEQAREAYYSILELHNDGDAYKAMLERMYYLNDDFYDTIYHFSAANERYHINNGWVKQKLNMVIKKIEESTLYHYDKYK